MGGGKEELFMKLATIILVFIGMSAKPLPTMAMMVKPQMSQEMVLKQIINACQKNIARRAIAGFTKARSVMQIDQKDPLNPTAAPYALDNRVDEIPGSIGFF